MKKPTLKAFTKGRKQGNIFNIGLDSTSKERVLGDIRLKIARKNKFFITTPNPEIVLRASQDKKLAEAINSSDFSLPDGVGLVAAVKYLSLPDYKTPLLRPVILFFQGLKVGFSIIFNRDWLFSETKVIKGREMFIEAMKLANKKGWRVYLLGGGGDEAEKTKGILQKSLKSVLIESSPGPFLTSESHPASKKDVLIEKDTVRHINQFKPHLLFVAFGMAKQEKWILKWIKLLDIGGAMVVGGTFRYIAGKSKLPPAWMEKFYLEWLWRLITEPWRFRRIINAFPIFPLKVYFYKLNQK